ncbi:hypothetical protein [Actinomyces culturomici]|uniref:hypothetical protein n=1 Tax=Actinomyces culturomici TaxID=1926276 RepID=UPI000E206EC2|nr:hypothetical protein [Actinomyces culturomici]
MIRNETPHYRPAIAFEQIAAEAINEAERLWKEDGLMREAADVLRFAAQSLEHSQDYRERRARTIADRETQGATR